ALNLGWGGEELSIDRELQASGLAEQRQRDGVHHIVELDSVHFAYSAIQVIQRAVSTYLQVHQLVQSSGERHRILDRRKTHSNPGKAKMAKKVSAVVFRWKLSDHRIVKRAADNGAAFAM